MGKAGKGKVVGIYPIREMVKLTCAGRFLRGVYDCIGYGASDVRRGGFIVFLRRFRCGGWRGK